MFIRPSIARRELRFSLECRDGMTSNKDTRVASGVEEYSIYRRVIGVEKARSHRAKISTASPYHSYELQEDGRIFNARAFKRVGLSRSLMCALPESHRGAVYSMAQLTPHYSG